MFHHLDWLAAIYTAHYLLVLHCLLIILYCHLGWLLVVYDHQEATLLHPLTFTNNRKNKVTKSKQNSMFRKISFKKYKSVFMVTDKIFLSCTQIECFLLNILFKYVHHIHSFYLRMNFYENICDTKNEKFLTHFSFFSSNHEEKEDKAPLQLHNLLFPK